MSTSRSARGGHRGRRPPARGARAEQRPGARTARARRHLRAPWRARRWRPTRATNSGSTSNELPARRKAAWTSAISFSAVAVLPLAAIGVSPPSARVVICVAVTLVALVLLGDTGARLGGAPWLRAAWRVLAWGVVAMAVTAGTGRSSGRPPAESELTGGDDGANRQRRDGSGLRARPALPTRRVRPRATPAATALCRAA